MLTTGIFLAVIFGTWALVLALLIPFCLLPLRNDIAIIRDSVKPLKQLGEKIDRLGGEIAPLCDIAKRIQVRAVDDWLEKRGINISEVGEKKESSDRHNSLPADRAAERDALVARGKGVGLTQAEATRLRQLLEEDARNDATNGVFTFLALAALLVLIAAFVYSITRRD